MQQLTLTPTTELEAVNAILRTISEAPVNTLVGPLNPDAAVAQQLLHAHSRAFQLQGWSFNKDQNFPLAPNIQGEVLVPANALVVTFPSDTQIVVRASKAYDRDTFSYSIGRGLLASITWFLAYEDLPEHARHFIYLSAGKQFQDQTLGDATLHQITSSDVDEAKRIVDDAEADIQSINTAQAVSRIRRLKNRREIR